jgi:F0F1-type ATP synthase alpha subunit
VPVSDVGAYETELYRTFELRHAGILTGIAEKKQIDDEMKGQVNTALKEFSQQFAARKAA